MLILQTGSAIAVRQSTNLVPVAVLFLLFVALFIVLRYVLKSFAAFLEKSAAQRTKKTLDVNQLKNAGKKLGLSKEEVAFLINWCKTCKITYLPLIASTEQCIAGPLKIIYKNICAGKDDADSAATEAKKLLLFTIIHKIENGKRSLTMITNSIAFPAGFPVTYTDENGINYQVTIIENTDAEMVLSIAQKKDGSKVKPPSLSKIPLTIQLKSGIAYRIFPRIVRYQQRRDFEEMVVTHTKNIRPMLQRKFTRTAVLLHCTFGASKVVENNGVKQYVPQTRTYQGVISDISAGGCKLRTMLPIKEGQYIQLSLKLVNKQIDNITGIVVRSGKDVDIKTNLLHTRFIRMSKSARNSIFSIVYNYDENT